MVNIENPPPENPDDSLIQKSKWFVLRPHPLAALFTCLVVVAMYGLGTFIISEYRALQLKSQGKVGGVYIDNLLTPYILSFAGNTVDENPPLKRSVQKLKIVNTDLVMRIWGMDGKLLYSSFVGDTGQLHDREDLHVAMTGNFTAKLETSGDLAENFPLPHPFMEIYAPIHDPDTGQILAIGEIYQNASGILRDRNYVENTIWAAIILAVLGVLALLALSFRQSVLLENRLKEVNDMAAQTNHMRLVANQARLDAAQANEQVLNLVGAELHDGPVQVLSLMSLIGRNEGIGESHDGTKLRSLTQQVMTELRTISSGLILPELNKLDTAGVIQLIVARHYALTGVEVDLHINLEAIELDLPRKICLYRVIQEGLTNALNHGSAKIPKASVQYNNKVLEISIHSGAPRPTDVTSSSRTWGLGLQGMRRRLDAFGGTLNLSESNNEVMLNVLLPVHSE